MSFLDIPTEVLRQSLKQTEMVEKRAEKSQILKSCVEVVVKGFVLPN